MLGGAAAERERYLLSLQFQRVRLTMNRTFEEDPEGSAAAYDSWLTVGIDDGDTGGLLGSVGINFAGWTDSAGIEVDNGAVFWMTPGDGPTTESLVAQLTVTTGTLDATINAQGRSTGGSDDWQARNINYVPYSGVDGGAGACG